MKSYTQQSKQIRVRPDTRRKLEKISKRNGWKLTEAIARVTSAYERIGEPSNNQQGSAGECASLA